MLNRIPRVLKLLKKLNYDALAINASADLTYLTGLKFHLSERPVILLITPSKQPAIIFPRLEMEKVKNYPLELSLYPYEEEKTQWLTAVRKATIELELTDKMIAVNPNTFRFLETDLLISALPFKFVSGEEIFTNLRLIKDETEIDLIEKAVKIAERALINTLPRVKVGTTENEIASELVMQLFRAGSDPELPFMPIVASGPNSANPHTFPSEREFQMNDLIIIDWGARINEYISDLTRTFYLGQPDNETIDIAKTVEQANTKAREVIRPQITAHEVDQTARNVIHNAGYGEYFIHRTGHGIGMEVHEEPYIQAGNHLQLEPGMVFTVEPGIYIPGKGGVRIEDNVAVTPKGCKVLSTLPRELHIIYE